MTENVQPGTGGAATGDRQAAVAEYNKQRQNLKELLGKRKQQERQLSQLEQSIVDLEAKYLSNTRIGNIVKGFDNYIKGTSSAAQRKQGELKDEDYIWSRSSISYNSLHPDNTEAPSATSTPAAPTPVSTTFANREKDSGSNQPTPTSATEKGSGKVGKAGKKRTQKKDKDADVEDSETDSREAKKVRTHFGASRK
ncbi:Chromatin modification-related protein eaf6 [Daldinia childiae]|uniref:Chromatin modification-related protein eaf6 n=1 Tax=Daldinia childiae TaxID=326645 RepID=UPI001446466A|nr:Chromatin modification-related protein eaf6 [Daldinia childiae]KAF3056318.1 Chromatin modification-related protein eaf6 [Daldinia childiae]